LITRGKIPYCVSGSIREQAKAIVSGKLQLKDSLPKLVVDSGRETDEKVIEFENSERFGILKEHVGDDLKFMENIIRKCLDHDRGKRPDAIDMVAELFPRIERLDRLEVGRSSESKKGLDLKDNPRIILGLRRIRYLSKTQNPRLPIPLGATQRRNSVRNIRRLKWKRNQKLVKPK